MQRLNEKQTVSCSSVGADVKQPVITDNNIIPESTRQVQQQNSGNRTKSNSTGV